ncbi:hypothetical protein [Burkholderia cenocepacia]|uniref:hypothetical protein n=1 Tax=Burkholderia cenocepacia TaxID=95486 RepID=UPI000761A792|nr:hypothetical protein [Burkholderia cenocepacia]KWU17947.1 hypothetical protein AS149_14835 [Burkholderia cenocepacia]
MSTIIDFRPTQSRQSPTLRAEHPERVTVETMLQDVLQPLFGQNPGLTNLEFKLRDPSRTDDRLGDDILSTAVNDGRVPAASGKAAVHPLEARGHSVRLVEATLATAEDEVSDNAFGGPVIQFRPRQKPVFDPYTPPPSAA